MCARARCVCGPSSACGPGRDLRQMLDATTCGLGHGAQLRPPPRPHRAMRRPPRRHEGLPSCPSVARMRASIIRDAPRRKRCAPTTSSSRGGREQETRRSPAPFGPARRVGGSPAGFGVERTGKRVSPWRAGRALPPPLFHVLAAVGASSRHLATPGTACRAAALFLQGRLGFLGEAGAALDPTASRTSTRIGGAVFLLQTLDQGDRARSRRGARMPAGLPGTPHEERHLVDPAPPRFAAFEVLRNLRSCRRAFDLRTPPEARERGAVVSYNSATLRSKRGPLPRWPARPSRRQLSSSPGGRRLSISAILNSSISGAVRLAAVAANRLAPLRPVASDVRVTTPFYPGRRGFPDVECVSYRAPLGPVGPCTTPGSRQLAQDARGHSAPFTVARPFPDWTSRVRISSRRRQADALPTLPAPIAFEYCLQPPGGPLRARSD